MKVYKPIPEYVVGPSLSLSSSFTPFFPSNSSPSLFLFVSTHWPQWDRWFRLFLNLLGVICERRLHTSKQLRDYIVQSSHLCLSLLYPVCAFIFCIAAGLYRAVNRARKRKISKADLHRLLVSLVHEISGVVPEDLITDLLAAMGVDRQTGIDHSLARGFDGVKIAVTRVEREGWSVGQVLEQVGLICCLLLFSFLSHTLFHFIPIYGISRSRTDWTLKKWKYRSTTLSYPFQVSQPFKRVWPALQSQNAIKDCAREGMKSCSF